MAIQDFNSAVIILLIINNPKSIDQKIWMNYSWIVPATKDRRIENAKQIHKNLIQRLFEASDEIALDLAALNIQRARDHGLAFYVEWRELCDLPKFNTWEDMEKAISPPNVRKLKEVYKSINLVELYPALLLEKTLPGWVNK